jgi:hypothetical protein
MISPEGNFATADFFRIGVVDAGEAIISEEDKPTGDQPSQRVG